MSDVSGPTPAGSAVTHAPVGVGGKALASGLPTALDNGDVAHVLTDAYGRLRVRLENADGSEWSGGGVDVSGTPSAGNYARFADADTLEARTTAQVLSDIGAQVAVVGVVDVATPVKITTTIPTDGTGDGRYAVRLAICGNVPSHQILSFELSGGIIVGTAYASSEGPRLSNSGIAAPYIYTGGSYVEIYIGQEGAGNYTFHVEAIGANYTTGWTITSAGSVAGSQATYRNQMMNVVLAGLGGTGHIVTQGASNGIVSTQEIGAFLQALTGKTTPVGADGFAIFDSAASNAGKSLTLTNLVAALKTLIATDTLAAPTDVTTNNATSSAHGFLPKLSNVATEFLNGVGAFATPAGGVTAVCAESYLTSQIDLSTYSANTWTTVTGWTSRIDTDSIYTTDDWTIPAGKGGKWLVEFSAIYNETATDRMVRVQIYVNGSAVTGASCGAVMCSVVNGGETMQAIASSVLTLAAGDVLTAKLLVANTASGYLQANTSYGQTTFKAVMLGA